MQEVPSTDISKKQAKSKMNSFIPNHWTQALQTLSYTCTKWLLEIFQQVDMMEIIRL